MTSYQYRQEVRARLSAVRAERIKSKIADYYGISLEDADKALKLKLRKRREAREQQKLNSNFWADIVVEDDPCCFFYGLVQ